MRLIPSLTPFAQQVLDRYETRAPVALAVRVALEHTFAAAEIDAIFEKTRQAQYDKTLHFSTVVDVMAAVVTQTVPSVNAGLVALGEALPVTRTAFYNKLNGTETPIAAALVDHSARKARALIEATGGTCAPVLPGYRLKIVDGAHIAHTERRLSVLWGCAAGPLPGFCLVLMEPDVMLVTGVIPCEDGHAQERSLTADLLTHVEAGDCLMADRNFCTTPILFGVAERDGVSVIRQHANLPWHAVGLRKSRGRIETGRVYEQKIIVEGADGAELPARRITLCLDTPTRDGDTELHIITTIPRKAASATAIAQAYAARWRIETAFCHMASWLEAEIETLGYPRAALLGFCVGLMAYNTLSVVQGALRAVHGEQVVKEDVSGYHIVHQARADVGGLDVFLEDKDWEPVRAMPVAEMAEWIVEIVRRIPLATIKKAKRGPKKPVAKRTRFKNKPHVSTKRLLDRVLSQ